MIKKKTSKQRLTARTLDWDSQFFNRRIVRLDLHDAVTWDDFRAARDEISFDLAYVFSSQESCIMQKAGATLVDRKVEFTKGIDSSSKPLVDRTKFRVPSEITDELLALAYLSGSHSRFLIDTRLRPSFLNLYREWLRKSICGAMADVVYCISENGADIAFISVAENDQEGRIGLLAVNPEHHGRGIGSALVRAAIDWCAENHLARCSVATQLDNGEACRFYQTNGFTHLTTTYVYHLWNL